MRKWGYCWLAKLRALKALHRIGAKDAASRDAYLAALSDSSIDVVEHALFSLVAMQDHGALDRLREMYTEAAGQRLERDPYAMARRQERTMP